MVPRLQQHVQCQWSLLQAVHEGAHSHLLQRCASSAWGVCQQRVNLQAPASTRRARTACVQLDGAAQGAPGGEITYMTEQLAADAAALLWSKHKGPQRVLSQAAAEALFQVGCIADRHLGATCVLCCRPLRLRGSPRCRQALLPVLQPHQPSFESKRHFHHQPLHTGQCMPCAAPAASSWPGAACQPHPPREAAGGWARDQAQAARPGQSWAYQARCCAAACSSCAAGERPAAQWRRGADILRCGPAAAPGCAVRCA